MRRNLLPIIVLLLLAAATLCAADRRAHFLPRLQPGQTITYLIRFQSDKNVKTESNVVAPMAPDAAQIDAHGLLRLEILGVQQSSSSAAIHLRGQFLTFEPNVQPRTPEEKRSSGQSIEFTIFPDGAVNEEQGWE